MSKSERVVLSCYDRVAIGGELLLFDHPGARPVATEGEGEAEVAPMPPTAEFAVEELQKGLRIKGTEAQEVNTHIRWAQLCAPARIAIHQPSIFERLCASRTR